MNNVKVKEGQVWECNECIGSFRPGDIISVGYKAEGYREATMINFYRGYNRLSICDRFLLKNFKLYTKPHYKLINGQWIKAA